MTDNNSNDALAYREFGTGCILGFHASANYGSYTPIADTNVHNLIINFIGHCGYCGVDVETSSTSVSCYGDTNGTASISISGGVPPYEIEWSTGNTVDTLISSLAAGTYTVSVTDSIGCLTVKQIEVESPEFIGTTVQIGNSVSCFGETDGAASVSVTGGTPPFTYAWNNGETSDSASALPAGNAIVTVTDSNGCEFQDTAVIVSPDEIVATYEITPVECDGDLGGGASVSVSGGVAPYNYSWSTGSTNSSIQNVVNGLYTLTIMDNADCEKVDSVVIYPLYLSPEVDLGEDLEICEDWPVQVSAGNGASFNWSTGQLSNAITIGSAGTYWVEVTNDSGCVGTDTLIVTTHTCLGIDAITVDQALDIYPNPSSGIITVVCCENLKDAEYVVYDMSGKRVMQGKDFRLVNEESIEIDLSNVQAGNYIIELKSTDFVARNTVVIE